MPPVRFPAQIVVIASGSFGGGGSSSHTQPSLLLCDCVTLEQERCCVFGVRCHQQTCPAGEVERVGAADVVGCDGPTGFPLP